MPSLTRRLAAGCLTAALILSACTSKPRPAADNPPPPPPLRPVADPALAQLTRAQIFLEQGLPDAAIAAFEKAIAINPKLMAARIGLGDAYYRKGDFANAAAAYEKAAQLAPNSPDAYYHLGLMRQLSGNYPEARKAYLAALASDPYYFPANRDLAATCLQMGKPDEALPYARKATEVNADDRAAWFNLGSIYTQLGQHDKAADAYQACVNRGEAAPQAYLCLAESLVQHSREVRATSKTQQQADLRRAAEVLSALIKKSPSAMAHERLGLVLFEQQQYPEAVRHYRSALSFDPDDTAALNGLGAALMTQYIAAGSNNRDLHEQALDAWQRSLRVNPDQPRIIDLTTRFR